MSGNSSRRRRTTSPMRIRRSRCRGAGLASALIAPRRSAGTCRSGARRRSRARALSIRRRLTNVPLSEPWSSTKNVPSRSTSTAWLRETVTSSRKISQSGERPMRVRSPAGRKLSPARPPPERTTSAGPSRPSTSSCCELADLVGARRTASSRPTRRPSRAARRSASSSSPSPGSGSRTRCSRRGSSGLSPPAGSSAWLRPPASPCRRGSPSAARRRPASSTLWPPDCWSRATSSARRMSILPCRMRRW